MLRVAMLDDYQRVALRMANWPGTSPVKIAPCATANGRALWERPCMARLSVLGLGRIGSIVATIGRAFGMKIIAWSPHLTGERVAAARAGWFPKRSCLLRVTF